MQQHDNDLGKSTNKLVNSQRENNHTLHCWYRSCVGNRTNVNLLSNLKTCFILTFFQYYFFYLRVRIFLNVLFIYIIHQIKKKLK